MLWEEYLDRLRRQVPQKLLRDYGMVREAGKTYSLPCIDAPAARTLVLVAGFHGEEPGGPLTFYDHADEILNYAQQRDVGLRVYPCVNPSGFELGQRYNASGEKPNNSVIEYEIEPGKWVGEVAPGVPEGKSQMLKAGWAKETWALVQDLIVVRPPHPAPLALLDLHQDDEVPSGSTYAYVFGGRKSYEHLMEQTAQSGLGRALACAQVDGRVQDSHVITTDRSGLCEYHDGTISAWAWSLGGAIYTATLETSSQSPPERATGINLLWAKGFIDLVAATRGM